MRLHSPLTLSQTSPGFYVFAVGVFWKHFQKRRNSSLRAISPFPTVFCNLFSSRKHKVLMVSFCDRPMSVIHNFFKHFLLLNHQAKLDETWQAYSLGEALPKLFKRLNSTHNSGCHGN